ncbi:MAG TPA: ATP-binding protein [Woeseiaceae bacterium]|nr:ATP-binding protein [Woeseiaceae bacterium]
MNRTIKGADETGARGPDFLRGGGAMGRRIRTHDWSATPLGLTEAWPRPLRFALGVCLGSTFPTAIYWGPDLRLLYNDAWSPIPAEKHPWALGRPAREVWADIWHVIEPQLRRVLETGEGVSTYDQMLPMQRGGSTEETYWNYSFTAIRDEHGSIVGVFNQGHETTRQVIGRRERQAEMERLQAMFRQAPGAIALLHGPDHVFTLANEAYLRLIGRRDVLGKPVGEALPEAIEQGFLEILDGVYCSGEPHADEAAAVMLQRTPGSPPEKRLLDFIYQPIRESDGAVTGIFVEASDVTERIQAEQALREEHRRKDEFLAVLAHELRNPLAPIRNATQLARAAGATATQSAWSLDVIERQAGHMTRLLDDLLEASRISRGMLELRRQRMDLCDAISSALETVRPLIESKHQELVVEVGEGQYWLDADLVRLAQVFGNLLANAAKYTDTRGRIAVRARRDGTSVAVSVRDDGVGMDPETLPHVFEMFSQANPRLECSAGGLGIGLALVRALVELHGGTVEARSEGLHKGSTFTVRLPLATAAGEAPSASEPAAPAGQPRRILVADDNVDAAQSLAMLLELRHHDVTIAHNGREALEAAAKSSPDVALLDIGMPEMHGYAVATAIRAMPSGKDVLLVAVTGWGQEDDRRRAAEAGFDGHLVKPVDPAALEKLIADAR